MSGVGDETIYGSHCKRTAVVNETLTLKVLFVILRDVTSVDVWSKYNTKQSKCTPPPSVAVTHRNRKWIYDALMSLRWLS